MSLVTQRTLTCDAREKLGRDTPFFREISEAAAEDPFRFRLLFAGLEASRTRVLQKKILPLIV